MRRALIGSSGVDIFSCLQFTPLKKMDKMEAGDNADDADVAERFLQKSSDNTGYVYQENEKNKNLNELSFKNCILKIVLSSRTLEQADPALERPKLYKRLKEAALQEIQIWKKSKFLKIVVGFFPFLTFVSSLTTLVEILKWWMISANENPSDLAMQMVQTFLLGFFSTSGLLELFFIFICCRISQQIKDAQNEEIAKDLKSRLVQYDVAKGTVSVIASVFFIISVSLKVWYSLQGTCYAPKVLNTVETIELVTVPQKLVVLPAIACVIQFVQLIINLIRAKKEDSDISSYLKFWCRVLFVLTGLMLLADFFLSFLNMLLIEKGFCILNSLNVFCEPVFLQILVPSQLTILITGNLVVRGDLFQVNVPATLDFVYHLHTDRDNTLVKQHLASDVQNMSFWSEQGFNFTAYEKSLRFKTSIRDAKHLSSEIGMPILFRIENSSSFLGNRPDVSKSLKFQRKYGSASPTDLRFNYQHEFRTPESNSWERLDTKNNSRIIFSALNDQNAAFFQKHFESIDKRIGDAIEPFHIDIKNKKPMIAQIRCNETCPCEEPNLSPHCKYICDFYWEDHKQEKRPGQRLQTFNSSFYSCKQDVIPITNDAYLSFQEPPKCTGYFSGKGLMKNITYDGTISMSDPNSETLNPSCFGTLVSVISVAVLCCSCLVGWVLFLLYQIFKDQSDPNMEADPVVYEEENEEENEEEEEDEM